jgi:hypothetical protein
MVVARGSRGSVALAKKHRQPAFVIPPSRLHDIERNNKIPSIHRSYALALIYGRTLNEVLLSVHLAVQCFLYSQLRRTLPFEKKVILDVRYRTFAGDSAS